MLGIYNYIGNRVVFKDLEVTKYEMVKIPVC